jgi:hypothetical protein
MTILWSNNASTTISGSITAVSTTVALAAGTGAKFPNPTGGNYYVATFYDQATKTVNEIVRVTAMAGDVATIVRAQEGTVARAWNAGDIFANLVTAGTLNAFVQAGTGPANTSIVYVGTDTSATPGLIICATNPVPASLAIGMLFNIKVNNTNPGAVNLQLNGGASVPAMRTDGSAMIAGNIIAGEEYMFVYQGSHFTSTIPPIPQSPPQTTFYVRSDSTSVVTGGIESNSGFANTAGSAFKTIQGAMNTIAVRYISQNSITIRVADGTYTSGAFATTNYISGWNIIGNVANPANCIIDVRSTVGSSYVQGSAPGIGFDANPGQIYAQGFTILAYYANAGCGGSSSVTLDTINFNQPVSGGPCISADGGLVSLRGTCKYTGTSSCQALFEANSSGRMILGYHDIYSAVPLTMNIAGTPSFGGGTAFAYAGGTIQLDSAGAPVTFTGVVPTGPQYLVKNGGLLAFVGSATPGYPGSATGVVDATTYGSIMVW